LTYTLPFAGNIGDIVINETTGGPASDILRFPGNGKAYFFSDLEAGEPANLIDLADQPFMPTPITPNVVVTEVGTEGNNSATFAPGATGIGGNANSPNLTYTIISDAVPEPTGLLLGVLGFGLLLAARRRR
jgi:MYXO-CTERM domain-containing protein